MPSFSIPLSGLTASSDELSTIANNLANMNTVGYKATSTQFQDLLYQNLGTNGAGNPIQIGLGVSVSSNESEFTQGSPDQTGVDTDMAINGNGFFVLSNNGQQLYTRAGNFTLGSNGALRSAGGASVMGYAANMDGTIDTNAAIQAITIDQGQQYPAQATSIIGGDLSLDSAATVSAPTATPTTAVTMAANFNTGATTPFSQNETVYDSSGTPHTLTYTFTPSATTPDQWSYAVTIPGADVGKSSATTVTSGTLSFSATTGALTAVTVDTGEPGTVNNASGTNGLGDVTGIGVTGLADGSSLSFNWDIFTGTTANLAQTSSASAVTSASQNGSAVPAPAFTATIPDVYDAQGTPHTLTINFWRTAENQYDYTMTIPGSDVGSSATSVQVSAGTLGFDPNTNELTSVAVTGGSGTVSPAVTGQTGAGNISNITIPSLADGSSALNFTWNIFNSGGESTITQTGATASSSLSANGYASSSLQSISVDANGTIEGVFGNGQSRAVAQLAIASFANEEGLELTGSNNYQQTLASGDASIGIAGTTGRGSVEGSVLEESNVDIATEFSNLIVAQQAYQANAKAVTTFDTIVQTTLNMQAP
jgi:flagellar hook protein FlgE